jgi:hypothetical protein
MFFIFSWNILQILVFECHQGFSVTLRLRVAGMAFIIKKQIKKIIGIAQYQNMGYI